MIFRLTGGRTDCLDVLEPLATLLGKDVWLLRRLLFVIRELARLPPTITPIALAVVAKHNFVNFHETSQLHEKIKSAYFISLPVKKFRKKTSRSCKSTAFVN